MEGTEKQERKKGGKSRKKRLLTVVIIALVVFGGAGFAGYKYMNTESYKQKRAETATKNLVKKIGKLMVLPEGQDPAVFNIEDPETLVAQQAFFKGAEQGDKLIVYPELSRAIIYSPKRDVIVNVGPITFDQSLQQQ